MTAALAAPAPAAATTYTRIGASGGAWNDNANWSPSTGFPNSTDDVAIVNGGASALAIAVPNTVRPIIQRLQINGAAGLISIVGVNSALSLTPLDGVPAIDYTGSGGLVINTGLALGRPLTVVRRPLDRRSRSHKRSSRRKKHAASGSRASGPCASSPRTPTQA